MWLVAGCRAFPVVHLRGRVSVARVAVVGGGQSRPPSLHAAVAPMLSRSAPADKPRLCVSPSSPRPAIPQGAGCKGKKSPAPCRFFLLFFRALAAARNSGYTEPSPFRTPVRSTHTLAVLTAYFPPDYCAGRCWVASGEAPNFLPIWFLPSWARQIADFLGISSGVLAPALLRIRLVHARQRIPDRGRVGNTVRPTYPPQFGRRRPGCFPPHQIFGTEWRETVFSPARNFGPRVERTDGNGKKKNEGGERERREERRDRISMEARYWRGGQSAIHPRSEMGRTPRGRGKHRR